jgi:glucokinase
LLDAVDAKTFYKNDAKKIKVPQSNKEVLYNEEKKIPICITKLGTNKAISIGACAIALASLQS